MQTLRMKVRSNLRRRGKAGGPFIASGLLGIGPRFSVEKEEDGHLFQEIHFGEMS